MRAIDRLPEKYREVFILRDVEHMTAAETATALGIEEGNVRTRLLRARLMLRGELAPGYDGTWLTEGDGRTCVRGETIAKRIESKAFQL